MNREQRIAVAEDTIRVLERGIYTTADKQLFDLEADIRQAVANSIYYKHTEFDEIFARCAQLPMPAYATVFEVHNETTLAACERLTPTTDSELFVLNFASAKNPGGGFLTGASAQEESLARSSALYPTLTKYPQLYQYNRGLSHCYYSDDMIYSPRVPVFKNDEGAYLNPPYQVAFLTSPAVNAGVVREGRNVREEEIRKTMRERLEKLLAIARLHGHRVLVLGAWGCGVFRNNPDDVAAIFYDVLTKNPLFAGAFERVAFAVLDNTRKGQVIRPFESLFAS